MVDIKNPSTTNCSKPVWIPFLRTAKSVMPGKINIAGKVNVAMNNGDMEIKEEPK
jgi:hypothetical protein